MYLESLKNKNVIITGCNKGIGKATLESFAENGANVFACVRSTNKEFIKLVSSLRFPASIWTRIDVNKA